MFLVKLVALFFIVFAGVSWTPGSVDRGVVLAAAETDIFDIFLSIDPSFNLADVYEDPFLKRLELLRRKQEAEKTTTPRPCGCKMQASSTHCNFFSRICDESVYV
ncbi:uncharacterized protein LOC142984408 [Anticarsia gemmatalis]|uniref:uncharacterized protein LOC142984408 n=1 Tax=Anticarsia gemmatalis TaxID=129554 RepID=UPI003F774410